MSKAGIEKESFGKTAGGEPVDRYTLRNARGMVARLITYGATLTELHVPDRNGKSVDVVLGYDDTAGYENNRGYLGATVGRVAFRIPQGRFSIDGTTYSLALNDGENHLHGGPRGLSKVVWQAEPVADDRSPALRFRHTSPEGDQGYPGTLDVEILFTLTETCELRIEYTAKTDKAGPINLTHHGYFNLAGAGSGNVLGHAMQLAVREVKDENSPAPKSATPRPDVGEVFRTPQTLASQFAPGRPLEGGIDAGYWINVESPLQRDAHGLVCAAVLREPAGGITMEVWTDQPAIIVYTGNYLDGTLRGKSGAIYAKHAGLCFETGFPPNAVNRTDIPGAILRPDRPYRHTCIYRFAAK